MMNLSAKLKSLTGLKASSILTAVTNAPQVPAPSVDTAERKQPVKAFFDTEHGAYVEVYRPTVSHLLQLESSRDSSLVSFLKLACLCCKVDGEPMEGSFIKEMSLADLAKIQKVIQE